MIQKRADFVFDAKGVIPMEFVSPGRTVNAFDVNVMERLRKRIIGIRREINHYDKVVDNDLLVREYPAQKYISVIPQSPYSPDLAPWDLCLFRKIKKNNKRHHFGTVANTQESVARSLHINPEEVFCQCFE